MSKVDSASATIGTEGWKKPWRLNKLMGIFAAGLLTLLPVGGTLLILGILLSFAYEWVGPTSRFGTFLVGIGFGGGDNEFVRYMLGLGGVVMLVFGVGILAEAGLRKVIRNTSDRLMGRIPVVKTVYDTMGNFASLLSKDSQGKNSGMSPVWCRFGEQSGVLVLGLLSSPAVLEIEGKRFQAVIVPTAPVPIGGGLFFMETDRITVAEGIGVDALTSIYVSMGVTASQFFRVSDLCPDKGADLDGANA